MYSNLLVSKSTDKRFAHNALAMFAKNSLNMFAITSAFISIEPCSRTNNSLMLFCFFDLASDFRGFHIPFEFPL